jgi:membrane protease YdiL (CAAX protease family)
VVLVDNESWLESLEAILVFIMPLLFIIPFYVSGFITQVSGEFIMYTVYIAGSIGLTKYNKRTLAEIGLTRKGLLPSLGNSLLLVLAFALTRFIAADLKLSPDVNSWEIVAFNLFLWALSGLGQEIIFRGLILFSFDRWKGWKVALLISTILFGLMHVLRYPSMLGIVLVSVIGGFWGWIALKTKNIVGTAIAHFLFNFLFAFLLTS